MLTAEQGDTGNVIYRFLRLTAFACCTLVVLSFAMFARDQMAGASEHQQRALVAGATPTASTKTMRHAQPRRVIDAAAKSLTTPFRGIAHSSNTWVDHGLAAALALGVYGLGLGYLARYAAVRGSA